MSADWPVDLEGVTESVVATRGEGAWNQAALGLYAPDRGPGSAAAADSDRVTARSWGNTRTRHNVDRRGEAVVQFTADPREFVAAAVTVHETDDPVLPGAAAWVEVDVEPLATGRRGGTRWTDWALTPASATVRRRTVPTIDRGFNAVVEATVAASRLDVPAYEEAALLERLAQFADVVETAGGPAEREAMAQLDEATGWRQRR